MPAAAQDAEIQLRPGAARMSVCKASKVPTLVPSIVSIRSPTWKPAAAAGLPGSTRATRGGSLGPEIPMLPTLCFWPKATSVEFSG